MYKSEEYNNPENLEKLKASGVEVDKPKSLPGNGPHSCH